MAWGAKRERKLRKTPLNLSENVTRGGFDAMNNVTGKLLMVQTACIAYSQAAQTVADSAEQMAFSINNRDTKEVCAVKTATCMSDTRAMKVALLRLYDLAQKIMNDAGDAE